MTVFIITVGDEVNYRHAETCLNQQTVLFRRDVVDRIAPLHAAFNEMSRRCETPFHVQVDEDMLLLPHAVETLFDKISAAGEKTAIVAAPLWDCDVERPIHGVKIYRTGVVARFPYINIAGCDVQQMDQLLEAGYEVDKVPLAPWSCLGEHGKYYTPETIFERWRRLVTKQRRYECDSWVESWPKKLAERYHETGSELHLWALLGAVAAIVRELPPEQEQDFRAPRVEFERLRSYFDPSRNRAARKLPLSTRVMSRLLHLLSRVSRAGR